MIFISFNQKQKFFSSNICENPNNLCASVVEMFVLIFNTPLELSNNRASGHREKLLVNNGFCAQSDIRESILRVA